jgi:hypothetical protein
LLWVDHKIDWKKKKKKRDRREREIKSKNKNASIPIEKAVGRRIN